MIARIDWEDLLANHGGECGRLVASFDWASTPLGPVCTWPIALRAVTMTILRSPVPQALLVGPAGILIYNDAYAGMSGSRHPGLLGQGVREAWPEAADFNDNVVRSCLAGAALSYRDQPFVLYRNGGPEDVWFDLHYSPVMDDNGFPVAVLGIVTETTLRVRAEQELIRSRERLAFALNSAGMIGTFDWHIASDLFFPDARLAQLLGSRARGADQGMPIEDFLGAVHPDDIQRVRDSLARAIADKDKSSEEYRLLGHDGVWHWVIARGECLYDHEGRPARFPGAIVDISELKESEEARSILLRELNHRVKNIFAVVSGLISMTARGASTPREMADALRGRLSALSAAHDLIRSAVLGETDMAETIQLADLLKRILAPHVDRPERLVISGPDLMLGPNATTSLALVFHELATNAAKYGALTDESGELRVAWEYTPSDVTLEWHERTAATTDDPPTHRGFGSQLIEMSVQRQLKGVMSYDWSGDGLRVALSAPVEQLVR
ncbi:HWE histidine kinase domain-containing protein [Phreatobacter sp. HK31-P]